MINTLYQIQQENPVQLGVMGFAKEFFDIDAKSRLISSPKFLSVAKDHKAENVYFRINRYVDYMDLATTTCIIQYRNEAGTGIFAVPFYDIRTGKAPSGSAEPDKLIFPWCIDGKATAVSGPIEYAIRFYRIDERDKKLIYNFNTVPVNSQILYGMDVQSEDLTGQYTITNNAFDLFTQEIADLKKKDIYWISYI